MSSLLAQGLARSIRNKVAELNEEIRLAHTAEVNVEIMVSYADNHEDACHLKVWVSQEVR